MRLRKFWLPRTAQPRYQCNVCGEQFYEGDRSAWEKHVVACAREHHDELVAMSKRERPPAFFQAFDKEYEAWVRKHGRVG